MEKSEKKAFERVREARDPERPYTLDLLNSIFEDFTEIHGDRRYAEDPALVCGMARIGSYEVAVIGHQKGRDTNQRRFRNFGMPKPEGYRKAWRLMKMAEKFGRPLITFIDTPGAYPGIDAEERGQAEAIAFNLREMANLKIPTLVVVLGEGGSGGALAIGIGDRVLMLENSVYSVISPEGCAAILWKDAGQAGRAAESLRLTAADLKNFELIDEIVAEPLGWKVNLTGKDGEEPKNTEPEKNKESESTETVENFAQTAELLSRTIIRNLQDLLKLGDPERMSRRFKRLRSMGNWKG